MNANKSTEEMIEEKGLTAPRVTKALINSKIVDKDIIELVTPKGSIILIGLYAMANGFSVTGKPVIIEDTTSDEAIDTVDKKEIITYTTISGSILRFAYKEYDSGLITVGRPSASVSAENDDKEIGVKIAIENCVADVDAGYAVNPIDIGIDEGRELALENAYSEIWALEGYLLATELRQTL